MGDRRKGGVSGGGVPLRQDPRPPTETESKNGESMLHIKPERKRSLSDPERRCGTPPSFLERRADRGRWLSSSPVASAGSAAARRGSGFPGAGRGEPRELQARPLLPPPSPPPPRVLPEPSGLIPAPPPPRRHLPPTPASPASRAVWRRAKLRQQPGGSAQVKGAL